MTHATGVLSSLALKCGGLREPKKNDYHLINARKIYLKQNLKCAGHIHPLEGLFHIQTPNRVPTIET